MYFLSFLESVFAQIKSLLKSGIIMILPLTLTVIIIKFLYSSFHYWLAPFGWTSIILVFCSLIIVGFLGQFLLAEAIVNPLEGLIDKIPLIRVLYFGIKSVTDFFNETQNPGIERQVVLIEYPQKGSYHIAFLLGTACRDYAKLVAEKKEGVFVKVFMPTTHLTSGFFLIVKKENVIETKISFEEAVKAIVSGGLISPTSLHKLDLDKTKFCENESSGNK